MEEMGMTDMQYKSVLKWIVSDLEDAKAKPTMEEMIKKIDDMIRQIKSDIES